MSTIGSHSLTISTGVKLMGESQVAVTVFEGGRFPDEIILAIAEKALEVAPETGFDRWTGGLVWHNPPYPDHSPDYTVTVQFVKIKK